MDLIGVKAHDVRAFGASKAFYWGFHGSNHVSLPLAITTPLTSSTTKIGLAGQHQTEGTYHLGAFVEAQKVIPPSKQVPGMKKGGTTPGT